MISVPSTLNMDLLTEHCLIRLSSIPLPLTTAPCLVGSGYSVLIGSGSSFLVAVSGQDSIETYKFESDAIRSAQLLTLRSSIKAPAASSLSTSCRLEKLYTLGSLPSFPSSIAAHSKAAPRTPRRNWRSDCIRLEPRVRSLCEDVRGRSWRAQRYQTLLHPSPPYARSVPPLPRV
jgi:hypothetical protein